MQLNMSRSAKKVKKIVFKLVLFAFLGYVIFLFINQFIKIKTKSDELSNIKKKISMQEEENREMKKEIANNLDDSKIPGKNSETIVFENVTE